MKLLIILVLLCVAPMTFAQDTPTETTETSSSKKTKKAKKEKVKTSIKLTNALVIGQMDTPDDRYSLEINLTDMMSQRGIKAMPSLNVLKLGTDARLLATDSIQKVVAAKGIDTYCIVTVIGFDRNYKVANLSDDFATAMDQASFFDLYRVDAVSISFQFKFFRDNKCVHAEVVKCGNIGSRESVIKRFRKKVGKLLDKKWR